MRRFRNNTNKYKTKTKQDVNQTIIDIQMRPPGRFETGGNLSIKASFVLSIVQNTRHLI